jgi:hypothetical protein
MALQTVIVNVTLAPPPPVVVAVETAPPGPVGASTYASYVATTSDDPVLSEAAWIAAMVPPSIDPATVIVPDAVEGDMIQRGPLGWLRQTTAEIKSALGLGSAAYTASTDYATAAQGALAASASQPGHTHSYAPALGTDDNYVTDAEKANIGNLGTAAYTATEDYAAAGHNHAGVYDPAGTATAAVSGHAGATDPHGDRAYADSLVVGLVDDRGNFARKISILGF